MSPVPCRCGQLIVPCDCGGRVCTGWGHLTGARHWCGPYGPGKPDGEPGQQPWPRDGDGPPYSGQRHPGVMGRRTP